MEHTFVILAYKESEFLEACIQSLISQTQKSTIIIATSTPNDFIRNISNKYAISLQIRAGEPNIADDWTFAFDQASTKYLTLAHQDDIYLPNYTSLLLSKAKYYDDTLISFCNYYELRHEKIVKNNLLLFIKRILLISLRPSFVGNLRLNRWLSLAFGSPICCPSVMFNKEKLGNWAFDSNYKVNLDWNSWIMLSKKEGRFVYQSEALMLHRIHEQSTTTELLKENIRKKEDLEIFTKLWGKWIGKLISKFYASSYHSNEL